MPELEDELRETLNRRAQLVTPRPEALHLALTKTAQRQRSWKPAWIVLTSAVAASAVAAVVLALTVVGLGPVLQGVRQRVASV